MKKRIVYSLVCLILSLFLFGAPCFSLTNGHDVYAKYIENAENCGRSPVKNEQASVTLPGGVRIDVSGIPSDRYILYVIEINDTEKAAMQWFSGCLQGKAKGIIYPYDIYLSDGEERVVLENEVNVTVSFPEKDFDKVFFIGTDGSIHETACSLKDRTVSFRSRLDSYCVLASDLSPSFQGEKKGRSFLWWLIAVLAVSGLTVYLVHRRKQKKRH